MYSIVHSVVLAQSSKLKNYFIMLFYLGWYAGFEYGLNNVKFILFIGAFKSSL